MILQNHQRLIVPEKETKSQEEAPARSASLLVVVHQGERRSKVEDSHYSGVVNTATSCRRAHQHTPTALQPLAEVDTPLLSTKLGVVGSYQPSVPQQPTKLNRSARAVCHRLAVDNDLALTVGQQVAKLLSNDSTALGK